MTKEELEKIAEQFKQTLSLEELDELERQYNEMYKKLKEQHESTTKEE